jgi:hypothetical protein
MGCTMKRIVTAAAVGMTLAAAGGGAAAQDYGGADGVDYDCWDFTYQTAAQAYFERDGGSAWNNADNLDPNGDGYACAPGDFDANGGLGG